MKLSEIMEASKATLSAGGGELPRTEIVATFDPHEGIDGIFEAPFAITFRELSANQELEALRSAKGDPIIAGFVQAKASIHRFNGEKVGRVEREWLYNHLNARGRAKVLACFLELIGSGEDDKNGDKENAEKKDE